MPAGSQPLVSVIIPCYNEEDTIVQVLQALADQTYPLSHLEVLVVDGLSTDRTLARIDRFAAARPDLPLRVIANPHRIIPAAMNLGIAQARGSYLLRMDAHALPARDYVARCVELLQAGVADNVGGRWMIVAGAHTPLAQAIALAVGHPFGSGDALYRYSQRAAYVDTVPFGAFSRELFERVGGYDEALLINEDYDLNYRIRRAGGRIYFSPQITATYYARSSLSALARQYFRYGWWKVRMLYKHPASVRWRQLVPAAFVAGLLGLGLLGLAAPRLAYAWLGLVGGYGLVNGGLAVSSARRQGVCGRVAWRLPIVFAVIHLSWGSGFWASLPGALFARQPARE
jgi:glycosyltransferase involved in cell wall biosynthesis